MQDVKYNSYLSIQSINKQFKNHIVLKNISLEVKPGEILGLVGINGIGKTTLIKVILGLLEADSGSVKLFGRQNTDIVAKYQMTYLPEKFTPSIFLKGTEFLSLAMGYYHKQYNIEDVRQLCQELDFDFNAVSKKISSYSKGMGQKLGLVSMFLPEVKLLVLDEPMSGLDPSARIALKHKLKKYVADGTKSIFFSSHILSDIEEICDRIAILHQGEIYYTGTVDEFVAQNSTHSLELAFLEVINRHK